MKILILGIDGMIGHKIAQRLSFSNEIFGTSRKEIDSKTIGDAIKSVFYVDFHEKKFLKNFNDINPDIIINCVGITIRRGIDQNKDEIDYINSKLPHEIYEWTLDKNKKLIHLSTDCVFDGEKGNYLDNDIPNAKDFYGLSKAKGELNNSNSLTIRCSVIGREIFNHTELLEWLLSNNNSSIKGFTNVIYSGITTCFLSEIINKIIINKIQINGIYNISSEPISKYELLKMLIKAFSLNIEIKSDKNIISNKVLISKKFTEITGIKKPSWHSLITELVIDSKKNSVLYKKY